MYLKMQRLHSVLEEYNIRTRRYKFIEVSRFLWTNTILNYVI